MYLTETTIREYGINENYTVEIVIKKETYEAWIQNREYGIKMMMFGVPKEQQSLDKFIEIVENNINEYIEIYQEEYENE